MISAHDPAELIDQAHDLHIFYGEECGCGLALCSTEEFSRHLTEAVLTALAPAFAEAEARGAREALEQAAERVESEGRREVQWLGSSAVDCLDHARLVGCEDAYREALRILRDLAATHGEAVKSDG